MAAETREQEAVASNKFEERLARMEGGIEKLVVVAPRIWRVARFVLLVGLVLFCGINCVEIAKGIGILFVINLIFLAVIGMIPHVGPVLAKQIVAAEAAIIKLLWAGFMAIFFPKKKKDKKKKKGKKKNDGEGEGEDEGDEPEPPPEPRPEPRPSRRRRVPEDPKGGVGYF